MTIQTDESDGDSDDDDNSDDNDDDDDDESRTMDAFGNPFKFEDR